MTAQTVSLEDFKRVFGAEWPTAMVVNFERYSQAILALGKAGVPAVDVSAHLEAVRRVLGVLGFSDYDAEASARVAEYVAHVTIATGCDPRMVPSILHHTLRLAGVTR